MPEIQTENGTAELSPHDLGLVDDVDGDDDGDDNEEELSARPGPRPRPRPAPPRKKSPLDRLQNDADQQIYEWISGLGSGAPIEVVLKRVQPPIFQGMNIKGLITTFDEPISEEQVQQSYGGGKYSIQVKQVMPNGQKRYCAQRTFEIAGDPKIDALPGAADRLGHAPMPMPMPDEGLQSQAMSMAFKLTEEARKEAREARQQSGTDWDAIDTLMRPLRDQIAAMQTALTAKDDKIADLIAKPVDRSSEERLFGILDSKETSYGNQLNALRIAHDTEMSQLREFNREEIRRRESRFEKEIADVRAAATREVDSLKMAHQQALDSQRHGFEMRIDGLKEIQKRLEGDNNVLRTELAELRARKELSPVDQIQGMVTLKNAFEALNPSASGGDDDNKSGWQQALETFMNSPIMEGAGARIARWADSDPQQPAAPANTVPIQAPDGSIDHVDPNQQVQVKGADGKMRQMTAAQLSQLQQSQMQQQQQAEQQPKQGDPPPQFDKAAIGAGVAYMVASYRGGTSAKDFAQTVMSKYPPLVRYVQYLGVDGVMAEVAKLSDGNPISNSIQGRAWLREVAQILCGTGTTEG